MTKALFSVKPLRILRLGTGASVKVPFRFKSLMAVHVFGSLECGWGKAVAVSDRDW